MIPLFNAHDGPYSWINTLNKTNMGKSKSLCAAFKHHLEQAQQSSLVWPPLPPSPPLPPLPSSSIVCFHPLFIYPHRSFFINKKIFFITGDNFCGHRGQVPSVPSFSIKALFQIFKLLSEEGRLHHGANAFKTNIQTKTKNLPLLFGQICLRCLGVLLPHNKRIHRICWRCIISSETHSFWWSRSSF